MPSSNELMVIAPPLTVTALSAFKPLADAPLDEYVDQLPNEIVPPLMELIEMVS